MKNFRPGDTFKVRDVSGSSFRIVESNETITYTLDLESKSHVPKEHLTEKLLKELEEGSIEPVPDSWKPQYLEEELSTKQVDTRNFRFKVINTFWQDDVNRRRYLEKPTRVKVVKELSEELNVSTRASRDLLYHFLKGGMTKNSLIPSYHNRGRLGSEANAGLKRGFKGKSKSTLGIRKKEREQFEKAYRKVYLNRNKSSLRDAYNYVLDHYYSRKVVHEDGKTEYIRTTNNLPSYDQFLYWRRKHMSLEEEQRAREGDNVYNNDLKVDRGGSRERTKGPGSCFEADATYLPINLVSKYNESLIIGTPTLFTAIDDFTGMITGFYLGLEHESKKTAARMLMNVVSDKVEFCAKHGIEITEEEWPSRYLPRNIMMDRGALANKKVIDAAHNQGMHPKIAPSYNPISKPNIENSHKRFINFISEKLPGAYKDDAGKRGAPDYREYACMNLDQLTRIIIELILHYNKLPNKTYPLTPRMEAELVVSSPAELWKWGVENGQSELIDVSNKEEFRISLMLNDQRTIGTKGIRFDNRLHVGADDDSRRVMNNNQGKPVQVYLNEDNVAEVYFKCNGQYYPLKIKENHNDYVGLTREEAAAVRKMSVSQRERFTDLVNSEWSAKQEEISREANQLLKEVPKKKGERKKRVESIQQNRENYLFAQRMEEARQDQAPQRHSQAVNSSETAIEDRNSGFNKRRNEYLENLKKEMSKNEE